MQSYNFSSSVGLGNWAFHVIVSLQQQCSSSGLRPSALRFSSSRKLRACSFYPLTPASLPQSQISAILIPACSPCHTFGLVSSSPAAEQPDASPLPHLESLEIVNRLVWALWIKARFCAKTSTLLTPEPSSCPPTTGSLPAPWSFSCYQLSLLLKAGKRRLLRGLQLSPMLPGSGVSQESL